MTTNPFKNALVAAGYISILATTVFTMPEYISDNELGMMAPVLFLSLFVISAALMGYLFVYPAIKLLIEGKQQEATSLFLRTLLSFAGIILSALVVWLLLSRVL